MIWFWLKRLILSPPKRNNHLAVLNTAGADHVHSLGEYSLNGFNVEKLFPLPVARLNKLLTSKVGE